MWWQMWKTRLALISCVLVLVVVVFLIGCYAGGRNCTQRQ